jgi:fatty-acyl-CoA synthase
VTEDELAAWAAAHVAEPAATPKHITRFDELPVTVVGKPNKLPLRAHATCAAIREACAHNGIDGVDVSSQFVDGSIHVIVKSAADEPADWAAVTVALEPFSFAWDAVDSE